MPGTPAELSVSLWRGGEVGQYRTYTVPRRDSQTVLDVVTFVQRHLDPTLSYRFACRVGVCGSCAMTVNGRPRWTCRTHVAKVAGDGRLQIGPLENLPVIKDLTADMEMFFAKWQQAKGVFAPSKTRHDAIAQIRPDSPGARRRRRRHRMHQLRRLLRRLRYGALECRISGTGGADAGVDARQRRTRRRQCRAVASDFGVRRLPRLPFAPILPGALPAGAQSDRRDRRLKTAHRGGVSQGRDQGMNLRLYLWQRATAAVMAPLVLGHIAVIFYAARQGFSAADILARTRGSMVWASYYGVFVAAASIHAAIGIRNILSEWSPLGERRAGQFAVGFGFLLAALGARAVAAVVLS